MRLAARGFERRTLGLRQTQGGAVIDRRPAERLLPLAAPVEFVGGLIGRIEAAQGLEPSGCFVVGGHPLGLAAHQVRLNSKPLQIGLDCVGVFPLRTLEIGVIEAQDERPVAALGEQPVQQRRADVADVDAAGRRRRETDDGGKAISPSSKTSRRPGNMV